MSDKMALVLPADRCVPHSQGFVASIPPETGALSGLAWTFDGGRDPDFGFDPAVSICSLPGAADDYPLYANVGPDTYFGSRAVIETDPKLKQPIPYAVISWNGQILCYRRPAKNTEARLSGMRSLGFGGHVEPADLKALYERYVTSGPNEPQVYFYASDLVAEALQREIKEELELDLNEQDRFEISFIGWINHDDTPVGKVHLGMVFIIEISGTVAFQPSDEIEGAELLSIDDAYAKLNEFEVWSQFVLRWLKAQQKT